MKIFIVELSIIAKVWKHIKCPVLNNNKEGQSYILILHNIMQLIIIFAIWLEMWAKLMISQIKIVGKKSPVLPVQLYGEEWNMKMTAKEQVKWKITAFFFNL
jgi:hypothetical protein